MRKLNNKGITTIEVILCFILVVVITVSMYGTVSSFNEKRILEQEKERIITYKELLTKNIQDDLIKVELTHAKYTRIISDGSDGPKNTVVHIVDCDLKDGSHRQLKVYQGFVASATRINTNTLEASENSDYFMIEYGEPGDLIKYPVPDLGDSDAFPDDDSRNAKIKDLTLNNISIKVEEDSVLSIYIGFYHPELGTKYGVDIICPINYAGDNLGGPLFKTEEEDVPISTVSTYVSKNGNDSTGDGTLEKPYASLRKAYEKASNIDTIYLMTDITQNNTFVMDLNKNITIRSCSSSGSLTTSAHSIFRGNSLTNNLIKVSNGVVDFTNLIIDGKSISSTDSMVTNDSTLNVGPDTILTRGNNSNIGGAIINNGTLNITGATFNNNVAETGAAIRSNQGTVTINSGSITNNTATTGNSGAIWNAGTLNIYGGNINNNNATMAGAINCTYNSVSTCNMTMTGGTINNNTSTNDGGAIYLNTDGNRIPTANITGGEIKNNNSDKNGGAITNKGNLTLGAVTISNNEALEKGGAVQNRHNLTVDGANITGNKAGIGGGINGEDGTINIQNVNISNNQAITSRGKQGYGGGIFSSKTLNISGGNITSNTAATYGGGLFLSDNSTGNMSGGNITGNTATSNLGGGVRVNGTLTITGGTIQNNDTPNDLNTFNISVLKTSSVTGKLVDSRSDYTYDSTIYNILSAVNNGFAIDLDGGKVQGNVHLYSKGTSNNQKWKLVPTKIINGVVYYSINSQAQTSQFMSVTSSSSASGANIQVWEMSKTANGRFFSLEKATSPYYYIKNIAGTCVNLDGGTAANKTNINTYTCDNTTREKWKLTAVS